MCTIDTHLPHVMMVLLPRIGGVLNTNPLEPSSEAILFDPNRRDRDRPPKVPRFPLATYVQRF